MLKLNGGASASRDATIIGLGFSDANLDRLMNDKPIHFHGEVLGFPAPGFEAVIFGAEDADGIKTGLAKILTTVLGGDTTGEVSCLHMNNTFYLTPIVGKTGRAVYIFGFDRTTCAALRGGQVPNVRCRSTGPNPNIEFLLFHGATEDEMEAEFVASGLIDDHTKIVKAR